MAITATSGESQQKELIPAGNYIARCYRMIEIGTVPIEYMGETKMQKRVRITWELPTETKVFNPEKGEQPFVIDKEYTLSLHEKSRLRADLQSWRGKAFTEDEAKAFDLTKLLGIPCMINIIHVFGTKDPSKKYQSISGITPMPKGITCPPQINETFMLSFDDFDNKKFEALPDFIKNSISSSEEYKKMFGREHESLSEDDFNDEHLGEEDGLAF